MEITFTNILTGKTHEMNQTKQEDGSILLSTGQEKPAPSKAEEFEKLSPEEKVEFWQGQAEGLSVTLGNVMKSHRGLMKSLKEERELSSGLNQERIGLEVRLSEVKKWIDGINEFDGEYDLYPEDVEKLRKIIAR